MTARSWPALVGVLGLLGAGWGLTQPLGKIAVEAGHRHMGIVVWQLAVAALALGALCALRRRPVPWNGAALRLYAALALLGTLLPAIATYEALRHMPAGWMAVMLSMVPIMAFPLALAFGLDRFSVARFAGLAAGLIGVGCLALPGETGAGAPIALGWVLVALIPAALYACEGIYVARYGTAGLDPVQALCGAALLGLPVAAIAALATGTWIVPLPPWKPGLGAILGLSVIHAAVYSGYVWLVGKAGPVFAAQVSYLVTGFGVLWSMLLLNERYGLPFWLALALMSLGLALVRPRSPAG